MSTENKREILVTDGKYSLSRLLESDRQDYVELQRQVSGDDTLFLNPLSKDVMWKSCMSNDLLFIILDDQMHLCGDIELHGDSRTPEIGISLLEYYRNKGIAKHAFDLLIEYTYNPDSIDYYLLRIKSDNSHSRHVAEKIGAEFLGEDHSAVERLMQGISDKELEEHKEAWTKLIEMVESNETVVKYKLDPRCR